MDDTHPLPSEEEAAAFAARLAAMHPSVTQVKMEAARRIGERYPVWRQLNLMREGGEALTEMGAAIDAIRDASNTIEAMDPIPQDFAADHRWPAA